MSNLPRKKAAALSYDQMKDISPKVSALGQGIVAENIIDIAKENDIPILEDASLVEILSTLNVNDAIPDELFEAVAEVFAFVYHLDKNS
ncbi:MAG TPA: EscU/YscU/HrcU family type III secretion system export apparatus switch protein [Pseudogracilibacillus sp.]|nr:EscU/YscU/HrcU family type III secretion system export apparatus switch protein [Pseudogracilibacillus sp.]